MVIANRFLAGLVERWWTLVVRGSAAILFGILTFVAPGMSLLMLVLLWGSYALVDGAFNLMMALRRARAGTRSGWFVFEGIVSMIAGIVTFFWPGITALVLLLVIAARAMLAGIAEIVQAIALRQHIRGEWLLATSGVLSIAFGVILVLFPSAGALAVLWLIGAYAVVFGGLLIALGLRLRRRRGAREREAPPGAIPTRA